MGAIPIVLALSGFVLLWAIVNYNNFSDKRNTIQQMLDQQVSLLRVRTDVLIEMAALFQTYGASLPVHLAELLNNPRIPSSKSLMEEALVQANAIANVHPALKAGNDFKNLKVNLVNNTNQLLKLQSSLTALVTGYNKQATSMPYRIIATIFGFKPVRE